MLSRIHEQEMKEGRLTDPYIEGEEVGRKPKRVLVGTREHVQATTFRTSEMRACGNHTTARPHQMSPRGR